MTWLYLHNMHNHGWFFPARSFDIQEGRSLVSSIFQPIFKWNCFSVRFWKGVKFSCSLIAISNTPNPTSLTCSLFTRLQIDLKKFLFRVDYKGMYLLYSLLCFSTCLDTLLKINELINAGVTGLDSMHDRILQRVITNL